MFSPEVLREVALSAGLFVFVWIVIGGRVLKPYIDLVIERENRTQGNERRAEDLRAETEQVQAGIESALREARLKGITRRDEATAQAKAQAQQMITAASDESAARLDQARAALAREIEAAQREVEVEAARLCDVVLKRVVSESSRLTVH